MQKVYDIIIIGSGPGGYVSAIKASKLKMSVLVVEKNEFGGVCLNEGCIPTKTILKSAEVKHIIDRSLEFGIEIENSKVHFEKIIERAKNIIKTQNNGINYLFKKNKIDHVKGTAKIIGPNKIQVEDKIFESKNILVATGARPRKLEGLPKSNRVWSSKDALFPPFFPNSLVVIGSGAIGIEFASFYKTFGSKVTVIEMMDRILPSEDREISELALSAFKGIDFHINSTASSIEVNDENVVVKVNDKLIKADAILVAIGVTGNIENLGLEDVGVIVEKGHIKTDDFGRTNVPSIFAIGDVAGAPWLAHKASHEGIICIEHMNGLPVKPMDKSLIPGCTYSMPQIASVGRTEESLTKEGIPINIGKFSFKPNGKALAVGETFGLIKTIFHKETGELLGAHMIGDSVTEMIQGFVIAKSHEATDESLSSVIFPHPTLSEVMHESILSSLGHEIHS